ncbi:DUF1289 domain-containing protein [Alteromonas pelagimontana]|uniref:DUF1289 domain-containing protein n=1 Tax=Alteromonas pelagimontana TaxID=1858656 RepID=A0A6M4MAE2_9ALTE|nr:DUF1289 domain-containing protein [Alteromonas pelagimontana]QJR79997.1 DUF1289 domain-containing protein [Alteromonas pelagimontana]
MASNSDPAARQLEFFAVPSPCIGVCQSGGRGYCIGCYRSRDERLYWLQVDDATRRKIIAACQRRKQQALRRKTSVKSSDAPVPQQQDLFGYDDNPQKQD